METLKKMLTKTIYFPAIIGILLGSTLILSLKYSILVIIGGIISTIMVLNPFLGILLFIISIALPSVLYISFSTNAAAGLGCLLLIASGQKKLKKTPLNWLLPVMYFTAILPAFVSDGVMENYLEHPKGLMTFIFYSLASLIIINLVDSTKKLEKVYNLLIIIGVIIGIICILQCFNLDPLEDYIYSFTGQSNLGERGASISDAAVSKRFPFMRRAIAYTGDAVATGAIEQTIFFLGLAFILTANTFFGKNLYRLLAFILFMGLFTPFSRSVWISSFLTSIYWWYKTGMNKKQLCLALIVLLSISYFFWDSVYERYYQTFVFKDYKKDEVSYQISQLKRFAHNPFVGTGIGLINEFPEVRDYFSERGFYTFYDPDADQEAIDADIYTSDSQVIYTSFYPGTACQLGIAGIVSVLLIIFSTFRVLSRSEKIFKAINNQKLYYLTMGLKTAFVGMLLHLAMRGDQTTILLWILIGLSWVTYNIAMEVKNEKHV